jgi:hypothetical protein
MLIINHKNHIPQQIRILLKFEYQIVMLHKLNSLHKILIVFIKVNPQLDPHLDQA